MQNIDILEGEIFVDVTDYAVNGVYNCYKVSNLGRVYDCKKNKFANQYIAYEKYVSVSLRTIYGCKNILLHRLMMLCFYPIEHPELFQVNHKDGDKTKNYLYNLEWCTRSENIIHAYNNGLCKVGEQNSLTTITDETAIKICEALQLNQYTNKQIADMYNTTDSVVSDIKQRHGWKHISKDYVFYQRKRKLFDEKMVHNLCTYFQNNKKDESLSIKNHCINALNYYGYEVTDNIIDSVRKIYTRKYYTNISNKYNF